MADTTAAAATAAAASGAAQPELARQLAPTEFRPVPYAVRLPVYLPRDRRGRPLRQLSYSAIDDLMCPERFRRRRLLKEYGDSNVHLLCGSAADAAITAYLAAEVRGEKITGPAALDVLHGYWHTEITGRYVDFGDSAPAVALDQTVACTRHYLGEVLPHLRRDGWQIVAVQHEFRERLAPALQWDVMGKLDQLWHHPGRGVYRIRDTKISSSTMNPKKAHERLQPGLYLSALHRAGLPVDQFVFDTYNRTLQAGPGFRSNATVRTLGQMRRVWTKVVSAAVQIDALAARQGIHAPWPVMLEEHWRCSARFCDLWSTCEGGGLAEHAA